MKQVQGVYSAPQGHWVGDGFPVRSLFSYHQMAQALSPFLLLDYAGPAQFPAAPHPRGVGVHPHRGFETVSIVYHGEVAHRDSAGNGGVIGPGDVQWMTAGAGILHEEFHSEAFTRQGGALEMVQLWVNLPAQHKMTAPSYQALLNQNIPQVKLAENAGAVRVIAGSFQGHKGPAHTFSPIQVWDMRLQADHVLELSLTPGDTGILVVLHGRLCINHEQVVQEAQFALLEKAGQQVHLQAQSDAVFLFLGGQALNEPVVGHGPFVMNNREEIMQAMKDFNEGRFGQMPH
jgi:redox-sensitive bicupin YhaK (pirin superfamily)